MLFKQDNMLCKQDIKSFEQHIKSSEQVPGFRMDAMMLVFEF